MLTTNRPQLLRWAQRGGPQKASRLKPPRRREMRSETVVVSSRQALRLDLLSEAFGQSHEGGLEIDFLFAEVPQAETVLDQ